MSAEQHVSVLSKLCFGLGGMPFQMAMNTISLFIQPFLLEQAQIRPIYLSIILFATKGWDAITDPLVGYLLSKTKTRWGKFRPWILCSMPFAIISYMMIWFVPGISNEAKPWWYLVFFCCFQLSSTSQRVPYTSFIMYLSSNQKERDSISAYRSICEMIGIVLAVFIQGAMLTIYGEKVSCESSNATTSLFSNHTFNYTHSTTHYNKLNEGYLITAGIVSIFFLVCSLATVLGTREINDLVVLKKVSVFDAIKSIFHHKPYLTLLTIFALFTFSVQMIQSNIVSYCKYVLEGGKGVYQYVLGANLICTLLTLALVKILISKIGKKWTYSIGVVVFIPSVVVLMFLNKADWLLYLTTSVNGCALAVHILLPWSMLPDVIDDFFLKTGVKNETYFYAFFLFTYKIVSGIASGVSNAFLEYAGFIDCPFGCCQQPNSVLLTLRLLIVPGPVIMLLVALLLIWKHPITEKKIQENAEVLFNLRENALLENQ